MIDPFPRRDVQLETLPGVIDFRWGHTAASLLPSTELARAAENALAKGDVAALSYGRVGGPASLIDPLADWLARHDDPLPAGNRLFVTAGTRPGGGFFVWVALPEGVESADLQSRAEEAGVAFVSGSRFCCCGGCERNIRLAFSLLDEELLREGAQRLAQALFL